VSDAGSDSRIVRLYRTILLLILEERFPDTLFNQFLSKLLYIGRGNV
jgi:hypothetical protein